MPALQRLHASSGAEGLRVIGISVDRAETRGAVAGFVKRIGVTYPVYVIERAELARLFTTPDVAVPLSVLLDADLRVVDVFAGRSGQTRKRLAELIGPIATR